MPHRPARSFLAVAASLLLASPLLAGRYEQHTGKAKEGPHLQPAAATYFGGEGAEEFVAAGVLPDGTVVAFGNSWGPPFPSSPKPTVLGEGEPVGVPAQISRSRMERTNPGTTGMIVFYNADLSKVLRVTRLGWGTAGIEAATVSADGKTLIVTGRSTQRLRDLAQTLKVHHTLPQPAQDEPADGKKKRGRGPAFGAYQFEGVESTGDTYVMGLDPTGTTIQWLWTFEGYRDPPQNIWTDTMGNIYVETFGLKRISADGSKLEEVTDKNTRVQAVDPQTGGFVVGGDRNTHTGREPWRQPYLYYFGSDGQKQWTMWEWNAKLIGSDKYRLVSDSSVRDVVFEAPGTSTKGDHTMLIAGWSDGGNSVFKRQPTELDQSAPDPGFISSVWGMKNANSIAYIMRIDADSKQQLASTYWVSFIPETFADSRVRNAPNHASISHIALLEDDHVGITGGAATGLIQTPNAFVSLPNYTEKYGGSFIAVFDKTLDHLGFSSYLPGCQEPNLCAVPGGVIVVSRSEGSDGKEKPHPTPVTDEAPQGTFGGQWDAHILLLKFPQ